MTPTPHAAKSGFEDALLSNRTSATDVRFATLLDAALVLPDRHPLDWALAITPDRTIAVLASATAVRRVLLVPPQRLVAFLRQRPTADSTLAARACREIERYLAGRTDRLTVDVDLDPLPIFQRAVLEETRRIPRGTVATYGEIAARIGHPGASRAVGTALGHNPVPILVPCHRVVRSGGMIGSYSGGGPEMKRHILRLEGVPLAG